MIVVALMALGFLFMIIGTVLIVLFPAFLKTIILILVLVYIFIVWEMVSV